MRGLKFLTVLVLLLLLPWTATAQNPVMIQGQGPREFRRVIKTDEAGRLTGGIHVIDACEATTGWTALGNDTTGLDTDLDHVLGAKSLEFDKVDGAANTVFGGIQKTISSVDLSFLVENGGAFGYSLNVGATTDVAYCFLRLGTDASNYNEWRVADAGLSAGWNSLRFNADTPSSAGATGNGWDATAVLYLALGCAFDLETSTLADLRVDHVTANVGLQVAADTNASVSSSSGASQVDVQKLGGNAIDLGAGAVGPGTQRTTSSSDDPAVVALEKLDDWDATEDGAASVDGAQVMFEARTAQKAAVGNGNAVRPVTNDHGEAIIAGYTWATDSNRTEEIDPLDQKYDPELVANVTDGTDAGGTTCPAGTDFCYYVSMDGYTNSGLQFIMGCDAGTVTATVECTLQTGTPSTLSYEAVTNDVFGAASLIAAAGSATDLWIDNAGKLNTCTYVLVRINANTTGNSGDWRIDYTKTAM